LNQLKLRYWNRPRQHHIQKDEVVIVDAGLVERCLSVERDIDSVGLFAKAFRQNLGSITLVFDQQYPRPSLRRALPQEK